MYHASTVWSDASLSVSTSWALWEMHPPISEICFIQYLRNELSKSIHGILWCNLSCKILSDYAEIERITDICPRKSGGKIITALANYNVIQMLQQLMYSTMKELIIQTAKCQYVVQYCLKIIWLHSLSLQFSRKVLTRLHVSFCQSYSPWSL